LWTGETAMKLRGFTLAWYILAAVLAFVSTRESDAGPLDETRCCITPLRNADGSIYRRSAVAAAYKRIWPCPSTHEKYGPCPGWSVNHAVPLACGGKDEVSNMLWMRNDAKKIQDSYERIIFGGHNISPGCP